MVFYVHPPDGDYSLITIIDSVNTRLKFFLNDLNTETEGLCLDHLCENTINDDVGHFMLRLGCYFSDSFRIFFLRSEGDFFNKRLEACESGNVRDLLMNLATKIRGKVSQSQLDNELNLRRSILHICNEMCKANRLEHAFDKNHRDDCRKIIIKVPFEHCSELVRKREVDLHSGLCHVHCGVWDKLLTGIFKELLMYGLQELEALFVPERILKDARLRSVVATALQQFSEKWEYTSTKFGVPGSIAASDIEIESRFFPPCVLNKLMILNEKKKLPHMARIELTIFLKSIGLDVNEAIRFWRRMYSQIEARDDSGCRSLKSRRKFGPLSVWEAESYHYLYNIQHFYGLKGSRRNYKMKMCCVLQNGHGKPGVGCPFVNLNHKELVDLLPFSKMMNNESSSDDHCETVKNIIDLASQEKPMEACSACFVAHRQSLIKKEMAKKNNDYGKVAVPEKEDQLNETLGECTVFGGPSNVENKIALNDSSDSSGSEPITESHENSVKKDILFRDPVQYYFKLKGEFF